MRYSGKEIFDITKAWLAISIAFGIVLGGFSFSTDFLASFLVAALTVGVGFIFHELSHKFLAQYYGHSAEFRSFDFMLLLAIGMSFFGFIFAAPGAVMIHGKINNEQYGKISAAGIVASLFTAAIFLIILVLSAQGLVHTIASYGLIINSWLGLFNLIPLWQLDGIKVYRWSKPAYFSLLILGLALLFSSNLLGMAT